MVDDVRFYLVSLAWQGVLAGDFVECIIDRFRIEITSVPIAEINMMSFTHSSSILQSYLPFRWATLEKI
jgi:hypothetical protein